MGLSRCRILKHPATHGVDGGILLSFWYVAVLQFLDPSLKRRQTTVLRDGVFDEDQNMNTIRAVLLVNDDQDNDFHASRIVLLYHSGGIICHDITSTEMNS